MKTVSHYSFMVVLAAAIAAGIYQFFAQYLTTDGEKLFLLFAIAGAWLLGFMLWVNAVVNDPRDPLGLEI